MRPIREAVRVSRHCFIQLIATLRALRASVNKFLNSDNCVILFDFGIDRVLLCEQDEQIIFSWFEVIASRPITVAELDYSIAGMKSILEGQSQQEALFLNERGYGLHLEPLRDRFILFTRSHSVRVHITRDELLRALQQAESFRTRF